MAKNKIWHVVRLPSDVVLKQGDEVTSICGKTYNYKDHNPKYACSVCLRASIREANDEIDTLKKINDFMSLRLNQILGLATPPEDWSNVGIRNLDVLHTDGCREIVDGEVCGKQQDHPVHGAQGDHQYLD